MSFVGPFLLAACQPDGVLGTVPAAEPLTLEVVAPVAGAFLGGATTIAVSGVVGDPTATVWVEGREVNVGPDGGFAVEVEMEGAFRIVDVEAVRVDVDGTTHLRERRTTFAGDDPLAQWPGAMTVRFTEIGLDHIAAGVASEVEALDVPGLLASVIPEFDLFGLSLSVIEATSYPPRVSLTPGEGGLEVSVDLDQMELDLEIGAFGEVVPVVVGMETLHLGGTADLGVDAAGALFFDIPDTSVDLAQPVLSWGAFDLFGIAALADPLLEIVANAAEGILDLGVLLLPEISLGEPVAFEVDLFGTPLALALSDLGVDPEGIGLALDIDLGVPAPGHARVPTQAEAGLQADVALALHEGLMQGLLASDLLEALDLDLRLDGFLGEIVALPLSGLPGGGALPADRTGVCLSLDLGAHRVARVYPSLDPLGALILPEVGLTVQVSTPTQDCAPWLDASLALVGDLSATGGTAIGVDLEVVDGAILDYAAGSFPEDDMIDGLGGLVGAVLGLVGGSLEIDLAELFTGGEPILGLETAPRLLQPTPVRDAAGDPIDGLVVLPVSLWD